MDDVEMRLEVIALSDRGVSNVATEWVNISNIDVTDGSGHVVEVEVALTVDPLKEVRMVPVTVKAVFREAE